MKQNTAKKQWHVTVQHFGTKATKVVILPGGLHEAEAMRHAVLQAGTYWRIKTAELREPANGL